jgi:hypothetical protein
MLCPHLETDVANSIRSVFSCQDLCCPFNCLLVGRYRWPKTLIVVSHAREFLNSVCTDILHLHSRTITAYKVPRKQTSSPGC